MFDHIVYVTINYVTLSQTGIPSTGFTVKQNSIQMYVISLWIWTLYLNGSVSIFFLKNEKLSPHANQVTISILLTVIAV